MACSGYVQVESKQKKGGIIRPGAMHLSLPLVERHSRAYSGSEENLISSCSSHWTISAVPKTSASLYSQASYTLSPRVFSEENIDRRRFAIAKTPAQEGPWSRKVVNSPIHGAFVLDLKSATIHANPFIGSDEDSESDDQLEDLHGAEKEVVVEEIRNLEAKRPYVAPEVVTNTSKEATQGRLKTLRMSTKVFGKMLSRVSVHRSSAEYTRPDEAPLIPALPPKISVSLPSPGLKMPSTPTEEDRAAKEDLRAFVLDKNLASAPKRSLARPSTWKPRRPPSPMPKLVRGHGKHKSDGSAFSGFVVTSPPPPLPTRRQIISTVRLGVPESKAPLNSSTSLGSAQDSDSDKADTAVSPHLLDVQKQLKERALKSSAYVN
ncbi:hypothetical protein H0H92_002247 [Tricholoma furcatifolium]|nr:hypothetical protein H0H92_002247 [Tricholoma furcatifolium]